MARNFTVVGRRAIVDVADRPESSPICWIGKPIEERGVHHVMKRTSQLLGGFGEIPMLSAVAAVALISMQWLHYKCRQARSTDA
jgi:hypothetical protein